MHFVRILYARYRHIICKLNACYMHFICMYTRQVALVAPLARRFPLENHITHLGATCNLPQNWNCLRFILYALYKHSFGIYMPVICSLQALFNAQYRHFKSLLYALCTHFISTLQAYQMQIKCMLYSFYMRVYAASWPRGATCVAFSLGKSHNAPGCDM